MSGLLESISGFEDRARRLETRLADPAVASAPGEYAQVAKELAGLRPLIDASARYRAALAHRDDARALVADPDPEVSELASAELVALEAQVAALEQELRLLLVPKDPNDEKNVMLEIRAGTGGDEAALFAADLLRMYTRYAERHGWKLEPLSISQSTGGGVKEAIAAISGDKVYSRLKYERGVHRVQRVPATEAQGRIHTSTVTVAVLPEAEEVDVQIDPEGPAHRRVPLLRPRRAERQHHGLGGAHHAPADRPRGAVPGREVAAQEQGAGAEDPARAAARGRAGARRRESAPARGARRWAAAIAARRSAPTTSRSRASPITAPASRCTSSSRSWRATSRTCSTRSTSRWRPATKPRGAPADAGAAANKTWTILELLRWTTDHFAKQGIETARLDAECLLAFALGVDRLRLYVEFDKPLAAGERSGFRELVRRRADERVPVSQLVGRKEFWSLSLAVTKDVLTPRPETETLVEAALELAPERDAELQILDIGTGSGAVALALASERPKARVTATDVSAAALAVARANAERLELAGRVRFVAGSLFEPVAGERFDLVVSNPPYLSKAAGDGSPAGAGPRAAGGALRGRAGPGAAAGAGAGGGGAAAAGGRRRLRGVARAGGSRRGLVPRGRPARRGAAAGPGATAARGLGPPGLTIGRGRREGEAWIASSFTEARACAVRSPSRDPRTRRSR